MKEESESMNRRGWSRIQGAWWSVSCCSDSNVDGVSKRDGGGFQERRKRGKKRKEKRHLDMWICNVSNSEKESVRVQVVPHTAHRAQLMDICAGNGVGFLC